MEINYNKLPHFIKIWLLISFFWIFTPADDLFRYHYVKAN